MSAPRQQLADAIARIASRGWCRATAGNFSLRLPDTQLRILMTPSGIDKSSVSSDSLIELDHSGKVLIGAGKASAEFLLHSAIYSERPDIGAVLHVHTVPNTVLSRRFVSNGELVIEGYEMLKALSGVTSHEHREVVPIFANNQNMQPLAAQVIRALKQIPPIHGFLLAGHGLYTFGESLSEAERHLEALEFLFEVLCYGEKE